MVLEASPSPEGGAPRVWVYRNTIKVTTLAPLRVCDRYLFCTRPPHYQWLRSTRPRATNPKQALNWYSSVREKLDDPKYSSWFIKFKDYRGPSSNDSYHVPACDWFGNASHPPKCSGFYHDQEQVLTLFVSEVWDACNCIHKCTHNCAWTCLCLPVCDTRSLRRLRRPTTQHRTGRAGP